MAATFYSRLSTPADLADFTKVVRELEKAGEIETKIARAAEKAAKARKGFAEASTELTKAMAGKVYSFPGPLADPDVYKAVVKMARQAIKTKAADAHRFIEELELARLRAKLGDLTPEELARAKQAWEEAKVLEAKLVADEAGAVARYGDSMTQLLARPDLPADLRGDIVAQVAKAMNNPAVDERGVRAAISAMRTAEQPHNVREFLAELRHVNQVSNAKGLAKGSKVYSGVEAYAKDGSLRTFDMGGGVKVAIDPVSEADALYRAGGKVHLDEVKHTASALANKLRDKPRQLNNMVKWRRAAPGDREIAFVVERQTKWTDLLGKPDVFELLFNKGVPLEIGGHRFEPAALKAFHTRIGIKYDAHIMAGGRPKTFMELPEMATLEQAFAFVGYP